MNDDLKWGIATGVVIFFLLALIAGVIYLGMNEAAAQVIELDPVYSRDIIESSITTKEVKYKYRTSEIIPRKGFDPIDEMAYRIDERTIGVFGSQQFYKAVDNRWFQVEYATTTLENKDAVLLSNLPKNKFWNFIRKVYAQVVTSYPSEDSTCQQFVDNTAYTTLLDSATCNGLDGGDANLTLNIQNGTASNMRLVKRGAMAFNLTAYSTSTQLTSSTLVLTARAGGLNNLTPQQVFTITSKTNYGTAMITSDYNKNGYGNVIFASTSNLTSAAGTKHNFILNNAGRAHILNQTANGTSTSFGLRWESDINQTQPDYVGSQVTSAFFFYGSEQTGTAEDPVLIVEFMPLPVEAEIVAAGYDWTEICEEQKQYDGSNNETTSTKRCYRPFDVYKIYVLDGLIFFIALIGVIAGVKKFLNL